MEEKITLNEIYAINSKVIPLLQKQLETLALKIENETQRVFNSIAKLYKTVVEHKNDVSTLFEKIYNELNLDTNHINSIQEKIDDYIKQSEIGNSIKLEAELSEKIISNKLKNFNSQFEKLDKQDEFILSIAEPLILEMQYNDRIRQGIERCIKIFKLLGEIDNKLEDKSDILNILDMSDTFLEINNQIKSIFTHESEKLILSEYFGEKYTKKEKPKAIIF